MEYYNNKNYIIMGTTTILNISNNYLFKLRQKVDIQCFKNSTDNNLTFYI